MAHVVTRSCCADGSCVLACPVNCIHPAPGEPGFATAEMLHIDPAACVGCGACVTACPTGAIKREEQLTPSERPFVALNAAYYEQHPHADRTPVAKVAPQRRLRDPRRRVRAAVVGAGPAGMFTADELLRHPEVVAVDVYERAAAPYGLVRSGVAPDHTRTKGVQRLFASIGADPRLRYRFGVEVGTDVTDAQLGAEHDLVVYTVGAAGDRGLGIPGEELPGSMSATRLAAWYNGEPGAEEPLDLDQERVVVVGHGNVALDVARILTSDPAALRQTGIGDRALAALTSSRVGEVVLLGRRGPAQAAFTVPELVGLAGLTDVDVEVDAPAELLGGSDPRSRVLAGIAARRGRPGLPVPSGPRGAPGSSGSSGEPGPSRPPGASGRRRIVLRFLSAPVRCTGTERVTGLDVARTALVPDGSGGLRAEVTDEVEHLETGLVVRSVGHRAEPVPGLPFDPVQGLVPNDRGRVRPGRYVAGWIKRGPRGFIGTNRSCARETVERILDDLDAGDIGPDPAGPADPTGTSQPPVASRPVPQAGPARWPVPTSPVATLPPPRRELP